ncbi:MAG: hypothetical protein LBQ34_01520 [Alphaproteobacteria bacterium]|jgi:uncharacterized coiled-coil DUF342 family protein|nr:hypothetical protein [Alphaproteobacteria bacterium]
MREYQMDSNKKPELEHYDIKQQFNNLLYTSSEITKHYDNLLLKIKDSIEESSPLHELIDNHYKQISDKNRKINGIRQTFKRFYKIYNVEKRLI